MKFKQGLRHIARRFGMDLVPYPRHDPRGCVVRLLEHHRVNCVIDVGANSGGFAAAIRERGYSDRIISFEPLRDQFASLRRKATTDGDWDAFQYAIGDVESEVTINVSNNSGLSSSVLPMLSTHTDAAPDSRYVGIQTASQQRLDAVIPALGIGRDRRMFLKVDVQGYERAVLDGASGLFADGSIVGLQLELSLVPLYDGAMTYQEGLDRAECLGMKLMGLDPVFFDLKSGQLLQVDAVFFAV